MVSPKRQPKTKAAATHAWIYDVFLSFRGVDERRFFAAVLYDYLKRERIKVFKDDANIRKGENIEKSITEAIEKSRFSIVVFSKNYVQSPYCMMELLQILSCNDDSRESKRNRILPIFYDVPSDEIKGVTKGPYKEALDAHERNGVKKHVIDSWRNALQEITKLAAYTMTGCRDVVQLIGAIIGVIKEELQEPYLITWKQPQLQPPLISSDKPQEPLIAFRDPRLSIQVDHYPMPFTGGGGHVDEIAFLLEFKRCNGTIN